MSGGVDSALAAALLKEADYEVSGIHLQLWAGHTPKSTISNLEHTCQLLDIPLHKLDLESEFRKLVVDPFCHEYSSGRTPNPCITCNRRIKFGLLLDRALQMGADYLASGHYARIERSPNGYHLLKAVDLSKDQSYFLYILGQKELQYLLMPLGSLRKAEVRKLADKMDLSANSQYESQDICFIPDNDYRSFVASYIPLKPGEIVDMAGNVMGKHSGLAQYTVGQRQGLGIASNKRLYVIKLDASTNRLIVGTEDQLLSDTLLADSLTWISGEAPEQLINTTAKVRYRSPEVAAQLHLNASTARVQFSQPQRAITPGQSVVFYQGDTVLGGGIITEQEELKRGITEQEELKRGEASLT